MQDLTIRGAAVDAALRAMPYLIAGHLQNANISDDEREALIRESQAIARWIDEAAAGRN